MFMPKMRLPKLCLLSPVKIDKRALHRARLFLLTRIAFTNKPVMQNSHNLAPEAGLEPATWDYQSSLYH